MVLRLAITNYKILHKNITQHYLQHVPEGLRFNNLTTLRDSYNRILRLDSLRLQLLIPLVHPHIRPVQEVPYTKRANPARKRGSKVDSISRHIKRCVLGLVNKPTSKPSQTS